MIEEDIADHARVVAVIRNQHATKRSDLEVRVGEGINASVLHDSLANAGREPVAQPPFDEIARQIADERLGVIAREKQMRKIVHARLRYAA